jgi:hypothetical protein
MQDHLTCVVEEIQEEEEVEEERIENKVGF